MYHIVSECQRWLVVGVGLVWWGEWGVYYCVCVLTISTCVSHCFGAAKVVRGGCWFRVVGRVRVGWRDAIACACVPLCVFVCVCVCVCACVCV